MNYCPNCGSKIESHWNVCPNCGNQFQKEEQPTHPFRSQTIISRPKFSVSKTPIYKSVKSSPENDLFGIIAVIFVIIAFATVFVIDILGLILGILAIVFGIIGWIKGDTPAIAGIGLFIGITVSLLAIVSLIIHAIL